MSSLADDALVDLVLRRRFGKYRGVVTDNADPSNQGRLKVRIPAVLEDLEIWAMPCVPYAGDGVGFFVLPDADALVWCEFEGGDVSLPIWVGCWWAPDTVPDPGTPTVKILKTVKGTISLDDDEDVVLVTNDSESSVTLNGSVTAESNKAKVEIGPKGVKSTSGKGGTLDVTGVQVVVNSGSLTVA